VEAALRVYSRGPSPTPSASSAKSSDASNRDNASGAASASTQSETGTHAPSGLTHTHSDRSTNAPSTDTQTLLASTYVNGGTVTGYAAATFGVGLGMPDVQAMIDAADAQGVAPRASHAPPSRARPHGAGQPRALQLQKLRASRQGASNCERAGDRSVRELPRSHDAAGASRVATRGPRCSR
jgi:hypothetical protein